LSVVSVQHHVGFGGVGVVGLPSRVWGPRETFSAAAAGAFLFGGMLGDVVDDVKGRRAEGGSRDILWCGGSIV